jgi:hypothetical protein
MRGTALNAIFTHSHIPRYHVKSQRQTQVPEFEMPHSIESSSIQIMPLVHAKDKSNVKFAAEVYGVDLNNFNSMSYNISSDGDCNDTP